MPHFNNYLIDQLIIPAVVLFFFIGGLVAVVIGVGLILRIPRVFRFFDRMNHSVSARHAAKAMAIPRDSAQFVWKYRRSIGIFCIVGAAYSLWGLVTSAGNSAIVSMLNLKFPSGFVLWIVESLRYLVIVGCTASIVVGILILISPNTLKEIDKVSSRWFSSRQITREAEKMNMKLDNWVAAFPRTAGLIIFFPALVVVMYFGELLLKQG
jgi:hypothetical protein